MRADAAATTSNHRKSSTSLSCLPFPILFDFVLLSRSFSLLPSAQPLLPAFSFTPSSTLSTPIFYRVRIISRTQKKTTIDTLTVTSQYAFLPILFVVEYQFCSFIKHLYAFCLFGNRLVLGPTSVVWNA